MQVETACKTYRVVTNETARRSVIVPKPVVAEPSFVVMLPPLKLILMTYSYIVAAINISAKTRQFTASSFISFIIPMFS